MTNVQLYNGVEMPALGLGTFPMNRVELFRSVYSALRCGYTSFDTGSAYGNEKWLGISLQMMKPLFAKDKIFITTKLSNAEQREGNVRKALLKSLKNLRINSLDLYLMHWPNPETYLDCWKQMEDVYKEGLVRAIGVCNFQINHLEDLLKTAAVAPMVNQVELHPLLTQCELRKYCEEKNIVLEAYSPVARMNPRLIKNEALVEIANVHHKTVPQVILRWDVQHQFVVIPKSSSNERIKQNIEIFDFVLSDDEMKQIDNLNENFRVRHDPNSVDFSKV